MSGYQGRTGPNVSQFLADLNTVPAEYTYEPFNNDTDLGNITSAEFIDWDADQPDFELNSTIDFDSIGAEQPSQTQTRRSSVNRAPAQAKMDDFTINGDFSFSDYDLNAFVGQPVPLLGQSQPSYSVPQTFASPVSTSLSPITPTYDLSNKKRKADEHIDTNVHQSVDEHARVAAEEDKRRRNTAASARFRVKKKQREAALEKSAKEMSEKVSILETRVQQLETENAWLKGLITEKNGGRTSSSEITAMLKKHQEGNSVERSTGKNTDGVGTENKQAKA